MPDRDDKSDDPGIGPFDIPDLLWAACVLLIGSGIGLHVSLGAGLAAAGLTLTVPVVLILVSRFVMSIRGARPPK